MSSKDKAKTVNILGVTGSVGQCAVDVILSAPEKFNVQNITAFNNVSELADLAKKLGAKKAIIGNPDHYQTLKYGLSGTGIETAAGAEALLEAASDKADLSLIAIVGMAGLRPCIAAIQNR